MYLYKYFINPAIPNGPNWTYICTNTALQTTQISSYIRTVTFISIRFAQKNKQKKKKKKKKTTTKKKKQKKTKKQKKNTL